MKKIETLQSLLVKYQPVEPRDFVLAQIAAKQAILETMLIDRLYPTTAEKRRAFEECDSYFLSLLESFLQILQSKKPDAASGPPPDSDASKN
ncbi:MAG TPA: hypothetical protein VFY06_16315 [Verrucomicrobiae bacterium]|nr:hypothetical protein [Verrucomicrobiae bacterium]